MLQIIREKAHGWIAWVIFVFIAMTFAMWGAHNYFQGGEDTTVVATVNGQKIRQAELSRLAERLRAQHQARLGPAARANPMLETLIKQQALQTLVQTAVLLNTAQKRGFALDQSQIFIALRGVPEFQEDGQFSAERFRRVLQQANMSEEQFYHRIYQDMLIQQLQEQFANSSFVLEQDIALVADLVNQTRDIDYLMIDAKALLPTITVTEDEINAYYQAHQTRYKTPEQVRVDYVTLEMEDLLAKITVTETDIEQFYQENISNFTEPASWNVAYIVKNVGETAADEIIEQSKQALLKWRRQALAGTDFAVLAKTHSDDPLTKDEGGLLGWVKTGSLDGAFDKVLAGLTSPGQVSEPVRTRYGLMIVKLIDIKPAKVKQLADVRDDVRTMLKRQRSEEIFAESSESFANISFEQPDSLTPVADTLGLTIQTSDFFSRSGESKGIGQYPAVVRAAFSEDILTGGNNSEVIQATPSLLVVLRLHSLKEASVKPLAEVREDIISALKTEKASQRAQTVGKQITALLKEDKPADAEKIWADFKGKWQTVALSRLTVESAPRETTAFIKQVFAMPRPSNHDNASQPVIDGFSVAPGFVVVKLKTVRLQPPADDKATEQQVWLRELLSKRYTALVRELYVNAQVQQAKVDIK